MKRVYWLAGLCFYSFAVPAQQLQQRISQSVQRLLADVQMKHATLGLSIVNATTGESVFEWNAQAGLAPASCQKIVTGATALELLQPTFRYQTVLGYDGVLTGHTIKGNLHIIGSGDPTLGSWRYVSTGEDTVLNGWMQVLKDSGVERITGAVIVHAGKWEKETLPGGWIWDDIGNYYGAGTSGLNWHENQYDLLLQPGHQIGDRASIIGTRPALYHVQLESELRTAAKGTGDNSSIFLPPFSTHGFVRGTIPMGDVFTVSGSFPDPVMQFLSTVSGKMDTAGITHASYISMEDSTAVKDLHILYTQQSPSLDSIIYWFMKKSVNLYGESLVKTMAYEKTGFGSAREGVKLMKQFWKEQGIEPSALHMVDGSGLSPQNRVTTDALVKVLQYARSRSWFPYYYDALPVYNQMKLKSGTIGGAKSFAGYHTSKDGTMYTVAIIVNNFDGPAAEIVRKMFLVLDELK